MCDVVGNDLDLRGGSIVAAIVAAIVADWCVVDFNDWVRVNVENG